MIGVADAAGPRRWCWLIVPLVLFGHGLATASGICVARPAALGVGVRWMPASGFGVHLQVSHIPGGTGAYGSGFQVSLRQLSWLSLAGGLSLVGIGHASDDASYAAMGAMVAPLGMWGLYRTRDSFTYITGEYLGPGYGVQHFAEDMRYIHDNDPGRRDIAQGLMERHPRLHSQFLWSLEVFRDPGTESAADRAFLEWYRGLVEEG